MSYFAQRANLEGRYGPANVLLMADMDGTNNSTLIANRIALALANADSWVRGYLRSSRYSHCLPNIVDRDNAIPLELTNAAVMYAGWWLLTARGTRDYDKDGKPISHLYCDYVESRLIMQQIVAGHDYLLDVEA